MNDQKNPKKNNRETLTILHQNVQSIGNSIANIEKLVEEIGGCSVLCITEHWKTKEQLENYGIQGFYLVASFCRGKNQHGGSAIYMKSGIFGKQQESDNFSEINNFECSIAEFRVKKCKVKIVTVYRPPSGDFKICLEKVNSILEKLLEERAMIFLVVDFNIEFLKQNKTQVQFFFITELLQF